MLFLRYNLKWTLVIQRTSVFLRWISAGIECAKFLEDSY